MKYGIREICNVVFKAKAPMKVGNKTFAKNQPVLYIDSAKTSTLEQATTTVYAQGGRGNTRLISWEGEKTLTFTVEDALFSDIGLSILSGAGLMSGKGEHDGVHVHTTSTAVVQDNAIKLNDVVGAHEICDSVGTYFVCKVEEDGSTLSDTITVTVSNTSDLKGFTTSGLANGTMVFCDYYVINEGTNVNELQITADSFGGNFYVEADTLFRRADGTDIAANIVIPNVKIQSNFTFNMAATGDPSTCTFTMDAMPDYTMFDKKKKVLCVIQTINESTTLNEAVDIRLPHDDEEGSI